MTDEKATIAANIQRIRKEQGLSQTALANAMQAAGATHWRQTTVSRVEQGKQEIRFDEVKALATVLGPDVFTGTSMKATPDAEVTLQGIRNGVTDSQLAKVEESLTSALTEVRRLRTIMQGVWKSEYYGDNFGDDGFLEIKVGVPGGADLGEHVEAIEVLPLESEMPGPREASAKERGVGIGDLVETREYEPMPTTRGPVEPSANERSRRGEHKEA